MKKNQRNLTADEQYLQNTYRRRFQQFKDEKDFRLSMWKVLVDDYFQQYVSSDDIVLDIPCGYGEFSTHIKAKKVIGVDLNPDSKQYLPKNVIFIQSSSDKIKLKDNSVDVIFVSNFFEHITHDVLRRTLFEFHRILKPKGRVMVLQPNIRFAAHDYWMFFDHINPVDDRALDEIFEITGFELVKKVERFLPYTTKSKLPKNLFFIKLYLRFPLLWRVMGKQSFLLYSLTKEQIKN